MEDTGQLLRFLKIHIFLLGLLRQLLIVVVAVKLVGFEALDLFLAFSPLLFIQFRTKTLKKVLVLTQILQSLLLAHIFASKVSLNLQLFFYYRHLLILLPRLVLGLLDRIPCLVLVLGQIIIEILHIFL